MLGDNSYASKLLFNAAAINSPKIEKIKGGGSRWAREPGWTGLKEFDIRVSISENKSSGELPFSLGILNFNSSSIGRGPYFSEFENQLQIIWDVLFKRELRFSLDPEYDGKYISFLLIRSLVIRKNIY